jgi:hypothetical protein
MWLPLSRDYDLETAMLRSPYRLEWERIERRWRALDRLWIRSFCYEVTIVDAEFADCCFKPDGRTKMKPSEFLKHFMIGDTITDIEEGQDGELVVIFDSGYRLVAKREGWKWERIPGTEGKDVQMSAEFER